MPAPVDPDGLPPLHPQVRDLVDQLASMGLPPRSEMSPQDARRRAVLISERSGPGPAVGAVGDVTLDGPRGPIPARVYQPSGGGTGSLVYLHGGGWVVGGLDESDALCRRLATLSGCQVLSVDYRLAPEHPFPAAAEDAYVALRWAGKEMPGPLAVLGDSAGGNLAAVAVIRSRDEGAPRVALQVLVYPVTDHDFETDSYRLHGDRGLPLGRVDMEWFWDHYLPDRERRNDPLASPLRTVALEGLPETIVVVAEHDPLRDDGLRYAARLADAGVPVTVHHYDDMVHGFFSMINILETGDAVVEATGREIAEKLVRAKRIEPMAATQNATKEMQ